jgi:hypothetical protein
MESGYTRPQKERLRKRKLKQALASQAKARAPGKKGMHGSTKELLAKAQGKPLGREMLEWTSIRLMQAAQYYWPLTADGQPKFRAVEAKDRSGQPVLDAEGKPTFTQVAVGDIDKFMKIAEALSLTSFRLARFQSPTLQAIAVAQQQSAASSEPIHYEVHIHNARGEHIRTTIDGEVVEDGGEPDMKLIESDRSDGPNE